MKTFKKLALAFLMILATNALAETPTDKGAPARETDGAGMRTKKSKDDNKGEARKATGAPTPVDESLTATASSVVSPESDGEENPQPPSASTGSWKYASGIIKRRAPNRMPIFFDVAEMDKPQKERRKYYAPVNTIYDPIDDDGKLLTVRIDKVGDDLTPLEKGTLPPISEKNKVRYGYEYIVSKNALDNDIITNGVIAGILVVPFKYHFNDHSLSTGNTTVGPYIGSETGDANLKISFLFSMGLNFFSVPSQTNSQTSTNLTGLSYAAGVAINSYDTVKILYVCGQDKVGGSTPTPYQYDGKWWCMAGLGYSIR